VSRNRLPFPPSARVPVGAHLIDPEPASEPAGRYEFHVVVAVTWPGRASVIDSFPLALQTRRITWPVVKAAVAKFAEQIETPADKPKPKVVPLSWTFVDFVSQERLEKLIALDDAEARADAAKAAGDLTAMLEHQKRADEIAEELGLERVEDAPTEEPAPVAAAAEGGEQP
jgi:hypothetical protein